MTTKRKHSIIATGRPIQMEEDQYLSMTTEDMGICRACGAEVDACEPDAKEYHCPQCDAREVFGIEELLTRGEVEFI